MVRQAVHKTGQLKRVRRSVDPRHPNTIQRVTGIRAETVLEGIEAEEAETRIGRRLQFLLDIERRNQQDRDVEGAAFRPRPKPSIDQHQAKHKRAIA